MHLTGTLYYLVSPSREIFLWSKKFADGDRLKKLWGRRGELVGLCSVYWIPFHALLFFVLPFCQIGVNCENTNVKLL